MNEVPIKYQAMFFSNMEDIVPSADIIPTFLKMFQDKEVLPSIFQEFGPNQMETKNRLGLISSNNEWLISIPRDRIIIQKNLTNFNDGKIGTLEEFIQDAVSFISRILKEFPRKGSRLALISSSTTMKLSDEKMQKIFHQFFNLPKFYNENTSISWKTNLIAKTSIKIQEQQENLNASTSLIWLKNNLMESGIIPFFDLSVLENRFLIELDINTYQGNTDSRFDIHSIFECYNKIVELQIELLKEWESFFNAK